LDQQLPLKNLEEIIEKRSSFRLFSKTKNRISRDTLLDFCTYVNFLVETIFHDIQNELSLYIIDNDHIINQSSKGPSIFTFYNGEFEEQSTFLTIQRDSLYLQEEMHDASVVFFFVWDKKNLSQKYPLRFYREINMISGFLGHQLSLKATSLDFRGTIFAGISPVEFSAILQKDPYQYLPIFAFAME
jgi:hypothetical protein